MFIQQKLKLSMASNVGEKRKSHPKEVTPGKDQKRPKTTDPEELRSLIDVVTYEDVLLADKILKDKLAIKPTPLKVLFCTDSQVLY